jgi:hypothetical protein
MSTPDWYQRLQPGILLTWIGLRIALTCSTEIQSLVGGCNHAPSNIHDLAQINAVFEQLKSQSYDDLQSLVESGGLPQLLRSKDDHISDLSDPRICGAKAIIVVHVLERLRCRPGYAAWLSSALNIPDDSGNLLLTEAIRSHQVDSTALLLACGADPHRAKAWDTLANCQGDMAPVTYKELRDLLAFNEFVTIAAAEGLTISSTTLSLDQGTKSDASGNYTVQDLHNKRVPFNNSEKQSIWIHVPSTNVSK